MFVVASSLVLVFATTSATLPPPGQRVAIHVRTSWNGLGPPAKPGAFDVECNLSECPFAVKLLLRCLGASPKTLFRADDLSDVVSWLQAATPEEIQAVNHGVHHALYSVYASPPVRSRFEASRTDPELIRSVLAEYYSPRRRWTDDYPEVSATIALPNGETATLSSRAQQEFMIPWSVTRSGSQYATYEPNIGRALAALGPPHFTGRERLAGTGLKSWLVHEFFQMAFQKERPRP